MTRRDVPPTPVGEHSAIGHCEQCDKVSWPSRKAARRYQRRFPATDCRPYQCPVGIGWHLGHLPALVRLGGESREDYIQRLNAQVEA